MSAVVSAGPSATPMEPNPIVNGWRRLVWRLNNCSFPGLCDGDSRVSFGDDRFLEAIRGLLLLSLLLLLSSSSKAEATNAAAMAISLSSETRLLSTLCCATEERRRPSISDWIDLRRSWGDKLGSFRIAWME